MPVQRGGGSSIFSAFSSARSGLLLTATGSESDVAGVNSSWWWPLWARLVVWLVVSIRLPPTVRLQVFLGDFVGRH